MKINKTVNLSTNRVLQQTKYNSNPLTYNQLDNISFTNKNDNNKKEANGLKKAIASVGVTILAAIASIAGCSKMNTPKDETVITSESEETNQQESNTQIIIEDGNDRKIISIDEFSAFDLTTDELYENNVFQLAQTKDIPSLTFDFTTNFAPLTIIPETSNVTLTKEPD